MSPSPTEAPELDPERPDRNDEIRPVADLERVQRQPSRLHRQGVAELMHQHEQRHEGGGEEEAGNLVAERALVHDALKRHQDVVHQIVHLRAIGDSG
jgi:hypothetical protein